MRDTWLSSFEPWQTFGYDACSGGGHVAVVATVSAILRNGGPPRDPGAGHGHRIARTVSWVRWYVMADRRGSVERWTTRGDRDSDRRTRSST